MEDQAYRWVALGGFFVILFIAWATGTKSPINRKTIGNSIFIAWAIGGLTFWFPWTRNVLDWVNDSLIAIVQASQ